MVRNLVVIVLAVIAGLSCVRFEKRAARYDTDACPICTNISHGTCSYCNGNKECMYCKGKKERLTVSPNIVEDAKIAPFSYKSPCPFCKSTGVCTYCSGTGKCWSCNGSSKVGENWESLNSRTPAVAEAAK